MAKSTDGRRKGGSLFGECERQDQVQPFDWASFEGTAWGSRFDYDMLTF